MLATMSSEAPGEWLRREMARRDLTTHDVAKVVGLRDQAVYYWLTGRTAPKDDAARKLAQLLEVGELEVRRRFGLWTPDDDAADTERGHRSAAELDELRAHMEDMRRQLDAAIELAIELLEQRRPS